MNALNTLPTNPTVRISDIRVAQFNRIVTGELPINLESFTYSPEKTHKQSTLNLLTEHFGIMEDGVTTFLPKAIAGFRITHYNGVPFFLSFDTEMIHLQVMVEEGTTTVASWKISKMLERANKKNPNAGLTMPVLLQLIIQGRLVVKLSAGRSYRTVTWRKMR